MQPDLDNNWQDRLVVAAKSLTSLVPGIGSLMGEIVGSIIPRQRLDRLAAFLRELDLRIAEIEDKGAKDRLKEPGFVDLLEDSMFGASRASSTERIQYLASLVANAIRPEHLDAARQRRIYWILDQLADPEIIMLQYYSMERGSSDKEAIAFRKLHEEVLDPPTIHFGMSKEEFSPAREANSLHDAYKNHLIHLHLLSPQFIRNSHNSFPEFDHTTGMLKVMWYELSALGEMLLRQIGLGRSRGEV
jgi:hypothetical protein